MLTARASTRAACLLLRTVQPGDKQQYLLPDHKERSFVRVFGSDVSLNNPKAVLGQKHVSPLHACKKDSRRHARHANAASCQLTGAVYLVRPLPTQNSRVKKLTSHTLGFSASEFLSFRREWHVQLAASTTSPHDIRRDGILLLEFLQRQQLPQPLVVAFVLASCMTCPGGAG